jgi:hypothetical protein
MIETVTALKRTLTPGTKLRLVNHKRPVANRDCEVHPKTNTVDLVTTAPQAPRGSHLRWPKARDYRPDPTDPATFHIDSEGEPFLTVTILGEAS